MKGRPIQPAGQDRCTDRRHRIRFVGRVAVAEQHQVISRCQREHRCLGQRVPRANATNAHAAVVTAESLRPVSPAGLARFASGAAFPEWRGG